MDMKENAQEAPTQEAPAQINRNPLQRLWTFAKETWKDHDLWVRSSAVGGGLAVVTETSVGIYFLLTMPLLIAAAGIVACGAIMGLGLYGVYAGATGFWSSLKENFAKAFDKNYATRVKKEPGKTFLQKLVEHPKFQKITQSPLVQKISNGPVGKILSRIGTQRQKDILMAGLTMKGSLVAVAISAAVIIPHMLALSVLTIGSIVTPPIVAAAWWGIGGSIDLYRGTKVMLRSLRRKKGGAANDNHAVAPAPVPAAAPSPLETAEAAPAFAKAAAPATPEAQEPKLPAPEKKEERSPKRHAPPLI